MVTEHAADGEKFSNALREQALLQAAGAKGKIQRRAEHEQDGKKQADDKNVQTDCVCSGGQ